jgi:hypothetical protein
MDYKEFDYIYDQELERLKSMLPDPNKYPYHVYRGAIIIFPKTEDCIPAQKYLKDPTKTKGFHEVIFEKFMNLQTRKMEWRQIVHL